jgi:hypothetical protein
MAGYRGLVSGIVKIFAANTAKKIIQWQKPPA